MKPTNLSQADRFRANIRLCLHRASSIGLGLRVAAILVLAGMLASSFYSASSASPSGPTNKSGSAAVAQNAALALPQTLKFADRIQPISKAAFNPMLLPVPPPAGETIETFDTDCTTPKTSFAIGDTVCVKVSGVSTGSFFPRRLLLDNANTTVIQSFNVTSDPQTFSFALTATSVIGGVTVDNRGNWRAVVQNPFFFFPEADAGFTVADPANPTAEVAVATTSGPGGVPADSAVTFTLEVKNYGPDSAAAVQLTDAVPANTTFVSFQQVSGPTFTCTNPSTGSTGTTTCTLASLVWPGPTAEFSATYQINTGTPVNTTIVNSASLSSTTDDQNSANNSTSETATIVATTGTACSFTCPENIVATATSASGANVTFASAINVDGDCGAISASPSSGSLFPVGVTTVNVTSGSGPGCSFTVTVVDTPAPTISCPVDKIATADGSGFATVAVGTPTTSPNTGVTVVGRRSDDTPAVYDQDGNLVTPEVIVPLTDPYPIGTTGITWTATDSFGRTAICTQRIVVHSPCASDNQPPTITAPADINVGTGPNSTTCGAVLDDELGQAVYGDDCSAVLSITGVPAGNLFPIGTTVVTYTATDGAGHTASDTQTVVVFDNTPPDIAAPADASYTCPSEVPAADPSQAHGTNPNLPNGGPVTDNCGTPTVTVSETSSGAGSASSPLIITRTYTALDSHGNSASAVQTITVVDNTSPVFTSVPANATYQCASEVPAASPSQATASDNCAAPTITVSDSNNGGAGTSASPLVITRTYTATDAAGNSVNAAQTITVIDNTPPILSCPANVTAYLPLNSTATSMVVNYPGASTGDNCGGAVGVAYSQISGTVFPVGTTTITVTATDNHGNTASCQFTVTVLYDFTGFFAPIENPPIVNSMKAGQAVPIKFSLSGNKGLNIFAVGSPNSVQVNCVSGDPVALVEETLTAGSSSLSYSASSDQYIYVWKTESAWKNTCRQLNVTLNDGSTHIAKFTFK